MTRARYSAERFAEASLAVCLYLHGVNEPSIYTVSQTRPKTRACDMCENVTLIALAKSPLQKRVEIDI
jgi:hypothetical protein